MLYFLTNLFWILRSIAIFDALSTRRCKRMPVNVQCCLSTLWNKYVEILKLSTDKIREDRIDVFILTREKLRNNFSN